MALSEQQMLLLDCFMYSDIAPNNSGKTLGEIVEQFIDSSTGDVSVSLIEKSGVKLSGDLPDHPDYLAEIMGEIYRDPKMRSLKITHTTEEYKDLTLSNMFTMELPAGLTGHLPRNMLRTIP